MEVEQECPVWPVFQQKVFFFYLKKKKNLRKATVRDPYLMWTRHIIHTATHRSKTYSRPHGQPERRSVLRPLSISAFPVTILLLTCCLCCLTCANWESISCRSSSSILCCLWMSTVAPIPILASVAGSADEKMGSSVQEKNFATHLGMQSTWWSRNTWLL